MDILGIRMDILGIRAVTHHIAGLNAQSRWGPPKTFLLQVTSPRATLNNLHRSSLL